MANQTPRSEVTRVAAPRRGGDTGSFECSEPSHRDGHGAVCCGAVAELAPAVPAPALNSAIGQQRARVVTDHSEWGEDKIAEVLEIKLGVRSQSQGRKSRGFEC